MRISDWSSDVCSSDLQLVQYVALLNKGLTWDQAAKEAFGDLGKLDQDLEAYRRTRGMKVFTIPADKLGTGKIEISRLSPGAAAIMPYRIRSARGRSEEHTSELQSLMRISYAVFCLKKKKKNKM